MVKIARAISVVRPNLDDGKYLSYALGIYRASLKYNVEPSVLIAITQQETGFREDLPEGKAGELGICQVLKGWLKNPRFKSEFKTAKVKDFHRPGKSFLFAAWILADLKNRITKGSLPYWSYYNATRFHNRFKYFLSVNKYVALLKDKEHLFDDKAVAADPEPVPIEVEANRAPAPLAVRTKASIENLKPKEASMLPVARVSRWIPDALKRIRSMAQSKPTDEKVQD